jgi:hypothetical protein
MHFTTIEGNVSTIGGKKRKYCTYCTSTKYASRRWWIHETGEIVSVQFVLSK